MLRASTRDSEASEAALWVLLFIRDSGACGPKWKDPTVCTPTNIFLTFSGTLNRLTWDQQISRPHKDSMTHIHRTTTKNRLPNFEWFYVQEALLISFHNMYLYMFELVLIITLTSPQSIDGQSSRRWKIMIPSENRRKPLNSVLFISLSFTSIATSFNPVSCVSNVPSVPRSAD